MSGYYLYEQSYLSLGTAICLVGPAAGCLQVRLVVPLASGGTMALPARFHRDFRNAQERRKVYAEFRAWCAQHRVEPDPNDPERLRPVGRAEQQMEMWK